MTVEERQLEEMEFERELVRRFFNARSYFFLCFSERLREELPPDAPGSEEDYSLVAVLLDRLQSMENPREELQRLAHWKPFRDYLADLDRSVQEFKRRPMPPDELKAAIEEVATGFLDAVLKIIRTPESRVWLAGYLGFPIQTEDKPAETPDVDFVEKQLTPQVQQPELFEEEQFLQNHFRSIVREQLTHAQRSSPDMHERIDALKSALLEIRDAAMIHGEEDIEMLCFKAVEILNRARENRAPKETSLELAEKVRAFVEQFVAGKDRDEDSLRVLMGVLQDALHGHFPPAEPVAATAEEPALQTTTAEKTEGSAIELAEEARAVETETPMELVSKIDEPVEMESPEEPISEESQIPDVEQEELDFMGLVGVEDFLHFEDEENEPVAESEDEPVQSVSPGEARVEEQPDESTDEPDFKLPGEDDEELKALIQEVRQHAWRAREMDEQEEPPETVAIGSESDPEEEASSEEFAPASVPYGQYQADVTLYLSVIESALETLRSDPQKRSALEDLELAAASIKSILRSMGDRKLWVVACSLSAAAARAANTGKPVDSGFLRAAESAIQLLSGGPSQSLNGRLETTVRVLTSWAHDKDEGQQGEMPVRTVSGPKIPDHRLADDQRPKFRLRGHGRSGPGA